MLPFKDLTNAYFARVHRELSQYLDSSEPCLACIFQFLATRNTKQELFLESLVSTPVFQVLRPVQVEGVLGMFQRNVRMLLADVMGLGKSFQVLVVLACLIQLVPNFTALLLAPPSLLDNWIQEAQKFIGLKRFVKIENTAVDWRVPGTQLYLSSASNTSAIRDQVIAERFKLLIFDESDKLRNPNAIVTQDTKCMAESMPFRILISGSPAVKVIHLYPILNIIAPEMFPNYFQFGDEFCRVFVNTPHGRVPKYDSNVCYNRDTLVQRLGTVMMRRYLDYGGAKGDPPGQVRFMMRVALPKAYAHALMEIEARYEHTMERVKALTDKMRKENLERRKMQEKSGGVTEPQATIRIFNEAFPELNNIVVPIQFAKSVGAVTQQCLQDAAKGVSAASSSIQQKKTPATELEQKQATKQALLMKMSVECARVKSLMVPAIMEGFLKLYPVGTKIVHFAHYKSIQEKLREYLQWKNRGTYVVVTGAVPKKQRQSRVNTFQRDPKCTDAILSPIAAGRGLTLTAGYVVIMWDQDWNFDTNLQAEARVNRLTQTKLVHIYYYVLDAISEDLRTQFVKAKAENMAQVIDHVRWRERMRELEAQESVLRAAAAMVEGVPKPMHCEEDAKTEEAQQQQQQQQQHLNGLFAPSVLRRMVLAQKKDLGVRFEEIQMKFELHDEEDLNSTLAKMAIEPSNDTVDEESDMALDDDDNAVVFMKKPVPSASKLTPNRKKRKAVN